MLTRCGPRPPVSGDSIRHGRFLLSGTRGHLPARHLGRSRLARIRLSREGKELAISQAAVLAEVLASDG